MNDDEWGVICLVQDDGNLFDETGMPQKDHAQHWKGKNGLYCTGFARQGLFGISNDAKSIAEDISFALTQNKRDN
jgi:indole-3-pyruvate monooxygenase